MNSSVIVAAGGLVVGSLIAWIVYRLCVSYRVFRDGRTTSLDQRQAHILDELEVRAEELRGAAEAIEERVARLQEIERARAMALQERARRGGEE